MRLSLFLLGLLQDKERSEETLVLLPLLVYVAELGVVLCALEHVEKVQGHWHYCCFFIFKCHSYSNGGDTASQEVQKTVLTNI